MFQCRYASRYERISDHHSSHESRDSHKSLMATHHTAHLHQDESNQNDQFS